MARVYVHPVRAVLGGVFGVFATRPEMRFTPEHKALLRSSENLAGLFKTAALDHSATILSRRKT